MPELTTATLLEQLAPLRSRIDAALASHTEFNADCPDQLRAAIQHSLLAPGKRLRPVLVLLAAEACGGAESDAMPAACAVEMIHAYSLIHDDLPAMDDDDLRRGQPTCYRAFGEALAILAGDALLARAFEVLATQMEPVERAARCCAELARTAGASALVGGQADDILGELSTAAEVNGRSPSGLPPNSHLSGHHDERGVAKLERIHRRKTGAMFLASLRLGGLIAGANAEQLSGLEIYGKKLGLAFQIVDDLLDVGGDEGIVGKRLGKDHARGKLTFPGLLGTDESLRRAQLLIDDGCAALVPFSPHASRLEALARFVLERNL